MWDIAKKSTSRKSHLEKSKWLKTDVNKNGVPKNFIEFLGLRAKHRDFIAYVFLIKKHGIYVPCFALVQSIKSQLNPFEIRFSAIVLALL
jgi:hypothetical protein